MAEIFRKEYKISLSDPQSIQIAIDAINRLNDGIPKVMDSLCNYLAKQGVKIAKEQINKLCKTPTGALASSVRFELSDGGKGVAYVVAGYEGDNYSESLQYSDVSYAVFVEFGYGTASYHDPNSGSLVKWQRRIDSYKDRGIKPKYGRGKDHPSGKGKYRDAETYGTITTKNGDEAFGWRYKDSRTGKWYTSHGQNPKPFMYNTLNELAVMAGKDLGGRLALYIAGYI